MAKRILLSGSHGRFENGNQVTYVKGQEIDLSDAELQSDTFKGRLGLGPIVGSADSAGNSSNVAASDNDDIDLTAMTSEEAINFLNTLQTVAEVIEFQAAEAEGLNRPEVLESVGIRLQVMTG